MTDILQLNEAAYEAIKGSIGAGSTEMDVFNTINDAFEKTAGRHIQFLCDIIRGERSIGVEGQPTARILQSGDTLIVDILPKYKGVYSDTTRTFFVGEPTPEQRKVYPSLLKALQAGERALKPGVTAHAIHAAVMDSIAQDGYGAYFPHHAGHCVGEEALMQPDFVEGNNQEIQEGMIVTLEPGIYIPNHFGIRIENNYKITETGSINLFDYPLDIDYFILKG